MFKSKEERDSLLVFLTSKEKDERVERRAWNSLLQRVCILFVLGVHFRDDNQIPFSPFYLETRRRKKRKKRGTQFTL